MGQRVQHALLSRRFVKGTQDNVCCTKQDAIVDQHTVEDRCEKLQKLVISMLRAYSAKRRCLCGNNTHDVMYGNYHHIILREYCARLCCSLVGETMKNITVCSPFTVHCPCQGD